jgi:DNA-binding transcriptional regulator YhcF (GntR family)
VIVRVAPESHVPPYEQVRSQVATMIASGQLPVGHRLAPIRQLAADLRLAPGTVARAYRALEDSGLVVSSGRRGTRVAALVAPADPATIDELLDEAAHSFATTVHQLGADRRTAVLAVRRALAVTASIP